MNRLCWSGLKSYGIMKTVCDLCPHACQLQEGQTGFCGVRTLKEGKPVSTTYGKISSMALDPVEKKPLRHFYPGAQILSIGSMGCNCLLYTSRCPWQLPAAYDSAGKTVSNAAVFPDSVKQAIQPPALSTSNHHESPAP